MWWIFKEKGLEDLVASRYEANGNRPLTSLLRDNQNQSETQLVIPYPRHEAVQGCLEVGRSLLKAEDGVEEVEALLDAIYGEFELT